MPAITKPWYVVASPTGGRTSGIFLDFTRSAMILFSQQLQCHLDKFKLKKQSTSWWDLRRNLGSHFSWAGRLNSLFILTRE
jgi:hypothetical protein